MSDRSEQVAKALQLLERALDCLDRADEVEAPPYVQMAIELLRAQCGAVAFPADCR